MSSGKVLTMEFVRGSKVTSISPLARIELAGAELADELLHAFLDQILIAGFFHADPHPGNVFVTDDGRLALLDLGLVGRLPREMQEGMLQLLLAASEGRAEEAAKVLLALGERSEDFDAARFRAVVVARVGRFGGLRPEKQPLGRIVLELAREAALGGVRLPGELALLGKTLLQLDAIARKLDPEFDANASFRRHANEIVAANLRRHLSPAGFMTTVAELKEFAERLPGRANRILEKIADNELEIRVHAIDERLLVEGFQKVANRITVGLVLAALIVGAAMLMRVETPFRLFGYPGFAMLCFLAATAGGVVLVGQILAHDRRGRTVGKS
jgi:predicted unusual protein kinase regulating ubiquinone biosynthesis (AarF/ABC1/UbiB family)